ncbi:unnamed protein product [Diamesa hyperborea]
MLKGNDVSGCSFVSLMVFEYPVKFVLLFLIFNYQASYNFLFRKVNIDNLERGCPLQTKPMSLYYTHNSPLI